MSIELINRVTELASEIGKAQIILEQKGEQIQKLQEELVHLKTELANANHAMERMSANTLKAPL